MGALDDTRRGYEILGVTVADGRRRYGRGTDHEVPTITVQEVGALYRHHGYAAALVFACAVVTNGAGSDLAHDLIRIGPWSWSHDVWTSMDALEIAIEAEHSIGTEELGERAADCLQELRACLGL